MCRLVLRPVLGFVPFALLVIGLGPRQARTFPARGLPDIRAACYTDNPYVVATCYRGILRSEASRPFDLRAPSILLFNETDSDYPHYELASFEEVGTVWGLAYSQTEFALYAAAFHKRQLPFGPAGPGGIYRLSLVDGTITTFATIPNAGRDLHDRDMAGPDLPAKRGAGKTSLGDLDLSEDERQLFAVNLADRKIYRYDVATGQLLGTIANGAAAQPWYEDARPFGLEIHAGQLYHGVINSAEQALNRANLSAYVYRSELDGSNMKEVARVDLTYGRGIIHIGNRNSFARIDWQLWLDNYTNDLRGGFPFVVYPMPMLTDIEIDEHDNMILGLRDRIMDTGAPLLQFTNSPSDENLTVGPGDVLNGTYDDATDSWVFDTSREHYHDDTPFIGDESGQGGLAHIWYLDKLVAGGIGIQLKRILENPREGYLWYDEASGKQERREETCVAEVSQRPWPRSAGAGDASPRFRSLLSDGLQTSGALSHALSQHLPGPRTSSAASGLPALDDELPPAETSTVTPTGTRTPTRTRTPTPVSTPTPTPTPGPLRGPGSVGDIELLCRPGLPTPTETAVPPTSTPRPRTPTRTPTGTPTQLPTATPVPPTPEPGPLYLPNVARAAMADG